MKNQTKKKIAFLIAALGAYAIGVVEDFVCYRAVGYVFLWLCIAENFSHE